MTKYKQKIFRFVWTTTSQSERSKYCQRANTDVDLQMDRSESFNSYFRYFVICTLTLAETFQSHYYLVSASLEAILYQGTYVKSHGDFNPIATVAT